MPVKIITSGAAQADADVCNALSPPTKGCSAGGGLHIVIPLDWQARIAAGQDVPGCTHVHLEQDGSLYVDDRAQLQLATPSAVNALTAAQQLQAAALSTKLAAVVVVTQQPGLKMAHAFDAQGNLWVPPQSAPISKWRLDRKTTIALAMMFIVAVLWFWLGWRHG